MRLDQRAVRDVAKGFLEENRHTWHAFGPSIQNALIDAAVMAHVRAAWSADADKPFTAAELINFRDRVVEALAAGPGRGHHRMTFKVEP